MAATLLPVKHDDPALAPAPSGPAVPAPIYSGAAMAEALRAYRDLQRALDAAMPDQILTLGDRLFRKKGYWKAVAVAFNLTVEIVTEVREVRGTFADGHDNFGYLVTAIATAPNGRRAVGDGAVFAVEKAAARAVDKWATLPAQATEHNIRAHAVTRATNRAISNLVGFGEVSAEEADRDEPGPAHRPAAPARPITISVAQQRRLFALARAAGWTEPLIRDHLRAAFGVTSTAAIAADRYEAICATFATPPSDAAEPPL